MLKLVTFAVVLLLSGCSASCAAGPYNLSGIPASSFVHNYTYGPNRIIQAYWAVSACQQTSSPGKFHTCGGGFYVARYNDWSDNYNYLDCQVAFNADFNTDGGITWSNATGVVRAKLVQTAAPQPPSNNVATWIAHVSIVCGPSLALEPTGQPFVQTIRGFPNSNNLVYDVTVTLQSSAVC
jgi:hypothetical protein